MMWPGVVQKYRTLLPIGPKTPVVTLGEGNTPLIPSPHLSETTGLDVYLKFEGGNPTGSFKDRGMTLAVTKALAAGARAILCASTGNTSASAAAYGARAGLPCFVLLPEGAVALGKLSQVLICNAKVIPIKGNFDDALAIARDIASQVNATLVNSINPDRIEGQKTGAFEICDQLSGHAPDFHLIPVGNAGNITAYWKGYKEYCKAGKTKELPRMLGFEAEGAAPIVRGQVVAKPQTFATAIRIGNPASWRTAIEARDESKGLIDCVSDAEMLSAYSLLATRDGLFVEPASAASVAGLLKLTQRGYFKTAGSAKKRQKAVCVLTGAGLKDPDTAIKHIRQPQAVEANAKSVMKLMNL